MSLGPLMTLPRLALRTTAKALRLLASAHEALADAVSPTPSSDSDSPPPPPAATSDSPAETAPQDEARDSSPPDVATLASRTAPEVIAALDGLSDAELADLHDYESRHRRRRSVLDAVAEAAAPPVDVRDAGDLIELDDPRQPDELVYSTQTPR